MRTERIHYHYCSLDTFIKIIEFSSIRLGDPFKMNDSKEIMWFIDLIPTVLNEYFKLENIVDQEVIDRYRYFYVDAVNELIKDYYYEESKRYITCFSEQEDVLSQWRAYADDGRGVSIGFNVAAIQKRLGEVINFTAVDYNLTSQESYAIQILEDNGLYDENTVKFSRMKDIYASAQELIELLLEKALIFKNPSFEEEREYRIILDEKLLSLNPIKTNQDITLSGPNFRTDGFNLISFYTLCFEEIKNEVIKSICIGPKSNVQEQDIRHLLNKNGYKNSHLSISKSKSSYR